jgi:hypothetical protein
MAQIRGTGGLLSSISCSQSRMLLAYLLYIAATYQPPPCPSCPDCAPCSTCSMFPAISYQDNAYYMFNYMGSSFGFAPNGTYYCSAGTCFYD